jgi:hypothetical protein
LQQRHALFLQQLPFLPPPPPPPHPRRTTASAASAASASAAAAASASAPCPPPPHPPPPPPPSTKCPPLPPQLPCDYEPRSCPLMSTPTPTPTPLQPQLSNDANAAGTDSLQCEQQQQAPPTPAYIDPNATANPPVQLDATRDSAPSLLALRVDASAAHRIVKNSLSRDQLLPPPPPSTVAISLNDLSRAPFRFRVQGVSSRVACLSNCRAACLKRA